MTYLSPDSTDIDECLDMVVRSLTAATELYHSLVYPGFKPETYGWDSGRKYSRVWHDNGTQRFVCFFVQRDNGDVWKAGGWKSPALNFTRGNILSREGRQAITLGKMNSQNGYFYPAF